MKISRVLFSLLLLLSLGPLSKGWGAPKEEATFSQVKGRVKVLNSGGTSRRVKWGASVFPGETIQVGPQSSAKVTLPDESTLNLSADTRLTITNLKHPSLKDKTYLFRLGIGKVFAQVRKLFSAKSSFEIEAGGVVCGVRGTEFTLGFNPSTNQMDLDVFNGAVGASGGGVTQVFNSGQSGHFTGGHWDGKIGNAPPPPPKDNGKEGNGNSAGSGGNGSNGTGGNTGNPASGNTTSTDSSGNPPSSGEDNNPNTDNTPPNPTQENPTTGFQPNTSLGDLDNQFLQGVVVNSENNLNTAQQNIHIHLVVP